MPTLWTDPLGRPLPDRATPRLANYDYRRPGWYFVTFRTWRRLWLFEPSRCPDGARFRSIVEREWLRMGRQRPYVELHERVVMANHFHGLLRLLPSSGEERYDDGRWSGPGPRPGSLGSVIGVFKGACALWINRTRGTPGAPVWQRSFYEAIVRTPEHLAAVRRYIVDNPRRGRGRLGR